MGDQQTDKPATTYRCTCTNCHTAILVTVAQGVDKEFPCPHCGHTVRVRWVYHTPDEWQPGRVGPEEHKAHGSR